jgi:hypothetical protein
MIETTTKNNHWGLNIDIKSLKVNQRKDALLLLCFLNTYGDEMVAFKAFKSLWMDRIYKLPSTNDKSYKSIKTGRFNTLSRMKIIYQKYMVRISPNQ